MSKAPQKRPLDNENDVNDKDYNYLKSKKAKSSEKIYSINECISIPSNLNIYNIVNALYQLQCNIYEDLKQYQQMLLKPDNDNELYIPLYPNKLNMVTNYSKINNNLLQINDYIHNKLVIFISINMYYLYYTDENTDNHYNLIKLAFKITEYLNILYDTELISNYNSASLNNYFLELYDLAKLTRFSNIRNRHFYFNQFSSRKEIIFDINIFVKSIYHIIENNNNKSIDSIYCKKTLINKLILNKLNFNFSSINIKIKNNIIYDVINRIEYFKLKKYINETWFIYPQKYIKMDSNIKELLNITNIKNNIITKYIPYSDIKNDYIANIIKNYSSNLINILPKLQEQLDDFYIKLAEFKNTFNLIEKRIKQLNYNGNLNKLPIHYYFRNKMNILKQTRTCDNYITLNKLFSILINPDNNYIPYGQQSSFRITHDYKKYYRIIPNYRLYFISNENNPYWSIKRNIYPNNELIITILCINDNNYNRINTKSKSSFNKISYLPEELWFLTFSFLKLSNMCGNINPQPKLLFN
jgi:hypothetical protein